MAETEMKEQERVLSALKRRKSMSFLELSSVADVEERDLTGILDRLKEQGLIRVIEADSESDEIVLVRHQALSVSP
jgi:DNA-binding MarR family transcriptional regulator